MDYPHINNFLQFTNHNDGSCTAVNYLTKEEFSMSQELAEALRGMNGKRSLASFFYDNDDLDGTDWEQLEEDLLEMDLLRRGRVTKDGPGSIRVALWMSSGGCSRNMYCLAAILHVLVKYLWLPILLAGIISHIWQINCSYYYIDYFDDTLLSPVIFIIAGMATGLLLHELSHAASGLVYGAPVFEIGIGFVLFFPCAYVVYDEAAIRNPEKALHTILAGVEMNFLFAGTLMILQFIFPACAGILSYPALINIILGIVNLFAVGPLDGYAALCILLRIPRKWGIVERGRILLGKSKVKGAENASEGIIRIAMFLLSVMQIGAVYLIVMEIWTYVGIFV